jgi:hypothetical protein
LLSSRDSDVGLKESDPAFQSNQDRMILVIAFGTLCKVDVSSYKRWILTWTMIRDGGMSGAGFCVRAYVRVRACVHVCGEDREDIHFSTWCACYSAAGRIFCDLFLCKEVYEQDL